MRYAVLFIFLALSSSVCGQGLRNQKLDQRLMDLMYRIGLEDQPPVFGTVKSAENPSPAEKLVEEQLQAYNERDIESFLAPYHAEVEIYNFPDELRMKGLDEMRDVYTGLFTRTPDLHCELVNRIVMGNTVIDQEHVTGLNGGAEVDAIAVYKIEDGKIRQVWFIR